MTTTSRVRATRTQPVRRPSRPMTEADIRGLYDCRCSRLEGTHQALHCSRDDKPEGS